jgi:hypothetical protein
VVRGHEVFEEKYLVQLCLYLFNYKAESNTIERAGCRWLTPCNPSNLGDRDQEDRRSKPAQANSSCDPISKKPLQKKGLVEWFKV